MATGPTWHLIACTTGTGGWGDPIDASWCRYQRFRWYRYHHFHHHHSYHTYDDEDDYYNNYYSTYYQRSVVLSFY